MVVRYSRVLSLTKRSNNSDYYLSLNQDSYSESMTSESDNFIEKSDPRPEMGGVETGVA